MKNPAFLFYTSDFITGTLFMNNEEVGAYIRVLCMQHQKGHLTEEEIKNICKKNKIFLSVISHFKQDKKGLFYNKRLDREKDKREKYSESRAKNRKKRIEDKINISSTYENISKTYDEHMENENEDENINNNIEEGKRKAFTPPTVQEVEQYCAECGLKNVDAQHFIDHYESNGWKVGKNPMKNWRSAVRNWSRHDFRTPAAPSRPASSKSSPTPNVNDIWK